MLTPEEQQELKLLSGNPSMQTRMPAYTKSSAITPEEQRELEALQIDADENKSFGEKALDVAIQTGELIDKYTGAPARAAVGALQEGKEPFTPFYTQFGEDTSQAPTGKMIAQKAGVSDQGLSDLFPGMFTEDEKEAEQWLKFQTGGPADITASGAAGLAADIAIDPLNLVGGGLLKGPLKKGVSAIKGLSGVDDAAKVARVIRPQGIYRNITESAAGNIREATRLLDKAVNPKQAENYQRLLAIANRNKVNPKQLPYAVEFGKSSFPSKMQRFKAEGPLGESVMNKMNASFRQVEDAIEKNIVNIGKATPKGEQYAGTLIRDGFDEAVKKLGQHSDITYGNIYKLAPGIRLSDSAIKNIGTKLNGIEKFAKGKTMRGVPGESLQEASHLLGVVKAIKNTNGSVKQAVEVMQDIGDIAFKSQNYMDKTPKDIKKLREIYFKISDGVLDTVKSDPRLGPKMEARLRLNNKVFKQFFDDRSFVKQIGSKKIADENLFRTLVQNGDSNQLQALRKILSPEKIQQLKGEYLGSLIKRNMDGEISFKQLYNSLERGKGGVNLLDEKELKSIKELLELYNGMGDRVLSYSGTGASNQIRDMVRHPIESLGEYVGTSTLGDALVKRHISKARAFPEQKALQEAKRVKRIKKIENIKRDTKRFKELTAISPGLARLTSSQQKGDEIKGKNKWALNGIDKLLNMDVSLEDVGELFNTTKGKNLLIQASGIKSNSKAMKSLIKKIDTHIGRSPDSINDRYVTPISVSNELEGLVKNEYITPDSIKDELKRLISDEYTTPDSILSELSQILEKTKNIGR